MDTMLIVVTALSLIMAAAMAVVVATMLRHERARSDARVEALSLLAAEPVHAYEPPVMASTPASRRVAEPVVRRETPAPRPVDDLEIRPAVPGVSNLFAEPERSSPWVNRLVAVGCIAAILLAVGVGVSTVRSRTASRAVNTAAQSSPKPEATPLELLALHHAQEPDQIVISGVVQNPRAAQPLARVEATVFVFGPDGAFLSSSRAPLDFTTLTPGAESSFVVKVPVAGQVARYRVGFRTEDGRVLPHVDKRTPDALAQK
jgi:hypothetical protein